MGSWVKREGIKQNKKKKKETERDTDNSLAMTRGKEGKEEVEDSKGGMNGDGRRLDFGG